MDMRNNIATDLSPLEQRRMRLRAFVDRMLFHIYSQVTQPISNAIGPSVYKLRAMHASNPPEDKLRSLNLMMINRKTSQNSYR